MPCLVGWLTLPCFYNIFFLSCAGLPRFARDSIPARSAEKLTATSDKKARASAPPVAVSLEQRRHGGAPPIRARNLGQPRGKRRHARRARLRARARAPRPRRGRKGGGRGTAAHKTTQGTAPARGAWRAPCRQRRGRGSVWAAAAAALRARASACRNRAESRPVHGDALRPPTLDTDRGGRKGRRHAVLNGARIPFSPRGHRRGTARSRPEAARGGGCCRICGGVGRCGAACRTRSDGSAARGRASRKWGRCAPPSRGARESAANAADSSRPLVSVACPAYQGRRLADGFRWRNGLPVKARPLYLCSPAPCWGMTDSSCTLCCLWRRKPQTGAAPPPPLLDKRTILRHAGILSDGVLVCNEIT